MSRYTGTSLSWSGIMSVASTTRNSSSRPGNRSRAKAYPAILPSTTLVTVMTIARNVLLRNRTGRGGSIWVHAYCQAWSVNGCGMKVICTESGKVLKEVTTDQAKGTNMRIAYPMSSA